MDNNAKIIIADVHDHILLKSIMCAASKLDVSKRNSLKSKQECANKLFSYLKPTWRNNISS